MALFRLLLGLACLGAATAEEAGRPWTIMTWNLQYGAAHGPLENRWPARQPGARQVLRAEAPDLLCVQEALADQLAWLEENLPEHGRLGVGRDDGRAAGEHCAILYDRRRFKALESGTFWLSQKPEHPGRGWDRDYNRICTWARLEDLAARRVFVLYNTHLPLQAEARAKSLDLIISRLKTALAREPVLLVGDFNSPPTDPLWDCATAVGLQNVAERAGGRASTPTFLWNGFAVACLDGLFCGGSWQVRAWRVGALAADAGVLPSDHRPVVAQLALPAAAPEAGSP